MSDPSGCETLRAAELIMQYLQHHEDAADTADGITTWWLAGSSFAVATVEQALKHLIAAGPVEQQHLPDGTVVYRRRRDMYSATH